VERDIGKRERAIRGSCHRLGILSAYTLPAIPGRDSFKGPAFTCTLAAHAGGFTASASASRHRCDRHSRDPEIAKRRAFTVFQRRPTGPRRCIIPKKQGGDGEIKIPLRGNLCALRDGGRLVHSSG